MATPSTLSCSHEAADHERGQYGCLWCEECQTGFLACPHVPALLERFFGQDPLPGSFIDQSFLQRLALLAHIHLTAWQVEQLRATVPLASSTVPSWTLQQVARCVESMIAARTRRMLERTRPLDHAGTAPPPASVTTNGDGASSNHPTAHPEAAAPPTGPPSNAPDDRQTPPPSTAQMEHASAMEVDQVHGGDTTVSPSPDPLENSHAPHSTTLMGAVSPRKRKQPADHHDDDARRMTSATPLSGRSNGSRRRPKSASASAPISFSSPGAGDDSTLPDGPFLDAEDADRVSLVASSEDSLVDDARGHVDRALQGVSSAKLIALYTTLCREHKKFAAENLRAICRENSFIAYWMVQQLQKPPPPQHRKPSSAVHTPQQQQPQQPAASEMDDGMGGEETAEEILARFRGSLDRRGSSRPGLSTARRRSSAAAPRSQRAVAALSSSMHHPSPSPTPRSVDHLPCAGYHAAFEAWPTGASGTCQYHSGILVWESVLSRPDSWSQVDLTSKMVQKNLQLLAWTCCGGNGESKGCRRGQHAPGAAVNGDRPAVRSSLGGGVDDSITLDRRPQPAPASDSSSPRLSTRDFIAQQKQKQVKAPKGPRISNLNDPLDREIYAAFPGYAQGDGYDGRHRKAREIIAHAHTRFDPPKGCGKCRRRGVACCFSEERDKCALCCSQNQSREACAKDWVRSRGGQAVPGDPALQKKVLKEDALAAWRATQQQAKSKWME